MNTQTIDKIFHWAKELFKYYMKSKPLKVFGTINTLIFGGAGFWGFKYEFSNNGHSFVIETNQGGFDWFFVVIALTINVVFCVVLILNYVKQQQ